MPADGGGNATYDATGLPGRVYAYDASSIDLRTEALAGEARLEDFLLGSTLSP